MTLEFDTFLAGCPPDLRKCFEPFRTFDAAGLKDADTFIDGVSVLVAATLDQAGTKANADLHLHICEWIANLWTSAGPPPIKRVMDKAAQQRSVIGMDKVDERSFKGYWNFFAKLKIHEAMLQDHARTNAYREAMLLNADAFKDKVVMDLGAGTGVLGFFALQAGAKHVYAIEASTMADAVEAMAKANGFGDRMTVVNSLVQDVSFDTIPANSVDILVSETLSHLIFNEKGCEGLLIARDRFVKPGGLILPDSATLHLAPFTDENMHTKHFTMPEMWQQKNFYGLDFSVLQQRWEKERLRTTITDMCDPKHIVAMPSSTTFDFKTMALEELDSIQAPCEWNIMRTSLVHGVIGWFTITLGTPGKMLTLCTGPWNEWTHWHQGRILVREPLAVNSGQRVKCDFEMKNNAVMSYDVKLALSLPGTDVMRENPNVSLLDPNSEFQKCIKVHGRVVGVPYNTPPNFIPEYVKQWHARQQTHAFQPAARSEQAQTNGLQANGVLDGAQFNGVVANCVAGPSKQEPMLHFGEAVMVPAQGEFATSLEKHAKDGLLTHITSHQGRNFLSPGGNPKQGVVEVVAGPAGAAPSQTWYWMPASVATAAAPNSTAP
jgi:histone-arginine methyltransferase CARM1